MPIEAVIYLKRYDLKKKYKKNATVSTDTEFGLIGCALPDLFRKDSFLAPKSQSKYSIGFQPTTKTQNAHSTRCHW